MSPRVLVVVVVVLAVMVAALAIGNARLYASLGAERHRISELRDDTAEARAALEHARAQADRQAQEQGMVLQQQLNDRDRAIAELEADLDKRDLRIADLKAELTAVQGASGEVPYGPACVLPDDAAVRLATVDIFRAAVDRDPTNGELDMLADEFVALAEQECDAHERGASFDAVARYQLAIEKHLAAEVDFRGRQAESARQQELIQRSLCTMDRMVAGEPTSEC